MSFITFIKKQICSNRNQKTAYANAYQRMIFDSIKIM